jgi:hypothetical protein
MRNRRSVDRDFLAVSRGPAKVDLDPLARDLARIAGTLQQEQLAAAQARQKEFAALDETARRQDG